MADLAQRPDIVDDEEIQQCHQVPKLPDSPPPMNQQRSPTYLKPLAYKSMNSVGFIIPLLIDIILVLAAGLFIILGLAAITRRNSPADGIFGSRIEEIMHCGPTIYPVLFTAVMSRSLKSVGRYFAERGIRLSNLCLLMNSTLIYDPMINLVYSPLSLFTAVLMLLWLCSPVGGQASLRLVHRSNITTAAHTELRYPDWGPIGNEAILEQYSTGDPWTDVSVTMRDVFTTSLMQKRSAKTGPTDLWGNVKIPRLEALKNMFVTPDKDGWYDVKDLPKKVESWSSLFGIPVIDLEDYNDQKISFFIESTYLSLSCGTVTSMGHNFETRYLTVDCPDCQSNTSPANHEWRPHPDTGLLNSRQDMFRGPPFPGLNALQAKNKSVTAARTIQFQSTELDNGSKYSCSVTQQPVEVVIKCSYGRCGATKIREWKSNPFRGENYTALDLWAKDALWLISDSSQNSLNSSEVLGAAQLFLNDSNAMPLQPMVNMAVAYQPGTMMLSDLSTDVLSSRSSILVNSAVMAMYSPLSYFGDLPSDDGKIYGPPHTPSDNLEWATKHMHYNINKSMTWPDARTPFFGASTKALVESDDEVYNPNYLWCILLITSSMVLAILGLAGIYCNIICVTPNMFDPVIGWTYLNPYLPLPFSDDEDNALQAEKRIGALGKTMVRLGVVNDDGPLLAHDGKRRSIMGGQEQVDNSLVSCSSTEVVLGAIEKVRPLRRSLRESWAAVPNGSPIFA